MITLLIGTALAEVPHIAVVLGWAGSGAQGYGFATCQPTLAQSDDAGLVLIGTASHQNYEYSELGGMTKVTSPGGSIGVGFKYAPGGLSVGLSTSFEVRRITRDRVDGTQQTSIEAGATLGADMFWQSDRRTTWHAIGTFSGANTYLWAEIGGMRQVVPLYRRDAPVALWVGLDVTAQGNPDARAIEGGLVLEVPVRAIGTSFRLRGGYGAEDIGDQVVKRPTVGFGMYWSY